MMHRLIPNARSYPYHLHLSRSLSHLGTSTHTYIPLAPVLLPILTYPFTSSAHSSSGGTLKPLDLETTLRAPQAYLKTRVYSEGLVDDASFVLGEWLASPVVHGSVAFPEIVVPIISTLRRALKSSSSKSTSSGKGKKRGPGKEVGTVKTLVDRIEESAAWLADKRRGVSFAVGKMEDVRRWEEELQHELKEGKGSPLGRWVGVVRKGREKRRALLEKVSFRRVL